MERKENNLVSLPKMKIVVISGVIVALVAAMVIAVACIGLRRWGRMPFDDDAVDAMATTGESETEPLFESETESLTESEIESETESETEPIPYDETGLLFEKTGEGSCAVTGIGTCTKTVIEIPEYSPEGLRVTSIATGAFEGCRRLVQIGIPSSVRSIGTGAFVGCESLTAFVVDTTNTYFCAVEGVLFSKDKTILMAYPAKKVGARYVFSMNVTEISPYAFEGVSILEKILYTGTVSRYMDVKIGVGNAKFTEMPIEFNYKIGK